MKCVWFVLSLVMICWVNAGTSLGAEGKPPAHFGRSVAVSKIFDITDDGENFFFRYPREVHIDSRQAIFVRDHDQIIEFNPQGIFQRNYFKKGTGPGELYSVANFFTIPGQIIVFNNQPRKILHFDTNGTLLRERPLYQKLFSPRLLVYTNGQYVLVTTEIPQIKGEKAFVDTPHRLIRISDDGVSNETGLSFPVQQYIINHQGARGSFPVAEFLWAWDGQNHLFISHTSTYSVKFLDLSIGKITSECTRPFQRIKQDPSEKSAQNSISFGDTRILPPKLEWRNDIQKIFFANHHLWIVTATPKNSRRQTIDLFDTEGHYVDSFDIAISGAIAAIRDNTIITLIQDKNGFTHLQKYRLQHPPIQK